MEYGLIGEKLSHSFSKIIHNDLCDYDYQLKELTNSKLDAFFEKKEFKAINVTIPYKEKVMKHLDFIDESARKIGAVNTVVNNNGRLYGYNTDFLGMRALIEKNRIEFKGKKVLILGSGGTSKTALAVAESLNADSVFRLSRSGGEGLITYETALKEHTDAQIIINTTPCGMYPNISGAAVDVDSFPKLEAVVDAIYNPLCTELAVKAATKGITAVGGLYMLVAQAVFAAEFFMGKSFPKTEIDRIYSKLYKEKLNLVLIGMPGCGKSTIGKALAKELGKEFIDSDEEIRRVSSKEIPQIFAEAGEAGFRKLESEVIAELAKKQSAVIATGGGAILNRKNIELLKENGRVIFLDRPLELLVTTDDRPLSSNRDLLQKRYEERYDIYCAVCDSIVDASKTIEENTRRTKEAFLNENISS